MALGQPMDYRLQRTDPLLSMMNGMQAGSAIQQVKEQELAKEQAAQSKQKLYELMNNPEATETDYRKFVALMPKEQQEGIMNVWNSMEEGKHQGMLDFTGSVMSALQGGQTEAAIDLLKKRSEAEKNSGNTALAQNYEMMAKVAETNPDFAMSSMGMVLATVPNGDKILKNLSDVREEQRKTEKQPLDLEKLAADIEFTKAQTAKYLADAKKSGADTQSVMEDVAKKKQELKQGPKIELSTTSEKLLNDSVVASAKSSNLAKQYDNIGTEIDGYLQSAETGAVGKAGEVVKKWMGSEDRVTRLRQEFKRLRNSAVLDMLPPGPATDKDIEIASSAFPEETSSPKIIADFMHGLARLQRYDAQLNQAKAEWVNQVGNLGNNRNDIVVNGVTIPAGTSFNDFARGKIIIPNIAKAKTEYKREETTPTGAIKQEDGTIVFPDGSRIMPDGTIVNQ